MVKDIADSRRRVIKTIAGLSATGIVGVGSATESTKAEETEQKRQRGSSRHSDGRREKKRREGSGSVTVDLHHDNMKSPAEMVEVAKSYTSGTDFAASSVVPTIESDSISVQGASPDRQKLDPVGGWNEDYVISGWTIDYADVENTAMLYKSQDTDNDGRYHYMMWLWSKAEPRRMWTYNWFYNRVNINTGDVYLANWAPTRTIDKNTRDQSVGIQIGFQDGPMIGLSATTEIKAGEFYTDEIDTGSAGKHKVRFQGHQVASTNAINGITHFRSKNDYGLYQDSLPQGHFEMYAEGQSGW